MQNKIFSNLLILNLYY